MSTDDLQAVIDAAIAWRRAGLLDGEHADAELSAAVDALVGSPASAPQSAPGSADTDPGVNGGQAGAQRADGGSGIDLRAAIEAALAATEHEGPSGMRHAIEAAAPHILRAAAEWLEAQRPIGMREWDAGHRAAASNLRSLAAETGALAEEIGGGR